MQAQRQMFGAQQTFPDRSIEYIEVRWIQTDFLLHFVPRTAFENSIG
ncbi:hypothetical protein SAMN04488523_11426 [Sulfitobacter brevis]|uniref:Uncharacterized protein n=1 Tax=Sulfitobacter brevis TaxID=74348 RepID=A0A1I2F0S3_9RHOB|nr:hypothetical protein SAMN04488523_11426 [Sulfitobacter brevis]